MEELNKKYNTEYTNRLLKSEHIFWELYESCNNNFIYGCGSYLFDGATYKYEASMYTKQELLYNKVKTAEHVLEIGTYMGHSLLIMLLSNPALKITCIDIDATFTGPAVKLLNMYFNNAITFLHMDSLTGLNSLASQGQSFDFFHIDGDHNDSLISSEFNMLWPLNKGPTLKVIFDDEETMRRLQINICRTYTVLQSIHPGCRWSNAYYEIKSNSSSASL